MRKPGCVEPVVYWVNGADFNHPIGYIILAPYTGCPVLPGYREEYADTLSDIDKLERKLQEQDRQEHFQEYLRDNTLIAQRDAQIRDKLRSRMLSSDCSQYEKDFIELYLQLRDERKKEKYRQLFLEHQSYLWARHNNVGNRQADKEEVNLDKINF